ncbi:MAG TPA: peptidoglycan DD-metalloendopeptidase family protein [Stellaceae bacterium]|nr:peptidoglycan DD-metalloendopeptidase family protein [Stellaceae bacterium]
MRRAAAAAALAVLAAGPAAADPPGAGPTPAATPTPAPASALAGLRRECVAGAQAAGRREAAVAAIEHVIYLLGRDAEGRQRDLDDSRAEQARLLGTIELLQRNAAGRLALYRAQPLDRVRSAALYAGTLPPLRAEARALAAEYELIAKLHREVAAEQGELATAHAALAADRVRLAGLIARRQAMTRAVVAEPAGEAARLAALGREASDIGDLIKRADAAAIRRDKALAERAGGGSPAGKTNEPPRDSADEGRPGDLRAFDPPQSRLTVPVSAVVARGFGAAEGADAPRQGISFAPAPGLLVVAPFDGRVTFAGAFRDLGVVLIIRHGGLYHSVLARLGRADVVPGEWVLAGEPVGAMPEAANNAPGAALYFELRRDSRPVDPQPWLAPREEGRDAQNGDQRVRE